MTQKYRYYKEKENFSKEEYENYILVEEYKIKTTEIKELEKLYKSVDCVIRPYSYLKKFKKQYLIDSGYYYPYASTNNIHCSGGCGIVFFHKEISFTDIILDHITPAINLFYYYLFFEEGFFDLFRQIKHYKGKIYNSILLEENKLKLSNKEYFSIIDENKEHEKNIKNIKDEINFIIQRKFSREYNKTGFKCFLNNFRYFHKKNARYQLMCMHCNSAKHEKPDLKGEFCINKYETELTKVKYKKIDKILKESVYARIIQKGYKENDLREKIDEVIIRDIWQDKKIIDSLITKLTNNVIYDIEEIYKKTKKRNYNDYVEAQISILWRRIAGEEITEEEYKYLQAGEIFMN